MPFRGWKLKDGRQRGKLFIMSSFSVLTAVALNYFVLLAFSQTISDQESLARYYLSIGAVEDSIELLEPLAITGAINDSSTSSSTNIYFHLVQSLKASGKNGEKEWSQLLKTMRAAGTGNSSNDDVDVAKFAKFNAERGDNRFIYAISTCADAASDYVASFSYLEAANEYERRHFRPWRNTTFLREIEDKKRYFTRDFFDLARQRQLSPQTTGTGAVLDDHVTKIVFIVGLPHAGSELLEQILNNHTQIFGLNAKPAYYEAVKYLIDFRYRNGMISFHIPEITKDTVRKLGSSGTMADFSAATTQEVKSAGLERYHKLIRGNMASVSRYAVVATGEEAANTGRRDNHNFLKYAIDTDLENFMNIGLIHLLYPDALFINVQRDPLDTLINCFQQRGVYANGVGASRCFGYNSQSQEWSLDLGDLATYYLGYLDIMHHWRSALPAGTIFDVSYEQLIQPKKLKPTVNKILNALGLDFEDSVVMTPESPPRYLDTSGSWRKYSAQLKPLIDKLKRHLAEMLKAGKLPLPKDINYTLL